MEFSSRVTCNNEDNDDGAVTTALKMLARDLKPCNIEADDIFEDAAAAADGAAELGGNTNNDADDDAAGGDDADDDYDDDSDPDRSGAGTSLGSSSTTNENINSMSEFCMQSRDPNTATVTSSTCSALSLPLKRKLSTCDDDKTAEPTTSTDAPAARGDDEPFKGYTIDQIDFGMFKRKRSRKGDFGTEWCKLKCRTFNSPMYNDLDGNHVNYKSRVTAMINELKKEMFLTRVVDEYTEYALHKALGDSSTLANIKGEHRVVIDDATNKEKYLRNLRCNHEMDPADDACTVCKKTNAEIEESLLSLKECLYVTKELATLNEYKYLESEMEKNAMHVQEDGRKIKLTPDDESLANTYTEEIRAYTNRHGKTRTLLEYLSNRECRNYLMINYKIDLTYVINVQRLLMLTVQRPRAVAAPNPTPEAAAVRDAQARNELRDRLRFNFKHLLNYCTKHNKVHLKRLLTACRPKEMKGLFDFLQETRPMNSGYTHEQIWYSFMSGLNITKNEFTFREYMKAYMHRRAILKSIAGTMSDINMLPAKSSMVYDLMIDNRGGVSLKVTTKHGVPMISINGSYFREFKNLYNVDVDEIDDAHNERTPIMTNKYGSVFIEGGSRTLKRYNVARSYKSLYTQTIVGDHYKKSVDYYVQTTYA